MSSMQSSNENEIVISFFEILRLMIKDPQAKRVIDWNMRFFERDVSRINPDCQLFEVANRMIEELNYCRNRRRSRAQQYNISYIDEVYCQYWLHKSPVTLGAAWNLYTSNQYRTGV